MVDLQYDTGICLPHTVMPLLQIHFDTIFFSGHVPWDHCKNVEYLMDTKELPEKECFYSSMDESNITDQDYQHCRDFFSKFKCKHLAEYIALYCWTGNSFTFFILVYFMIPNLYFLYL